MHGFGKIAHFCKKKKKKGYAAAQNATVGITKYNLS
jgi:hypothetical protein